MDFVLVPFKDNSIAPELKGSIRRDHSRLLVEFTEICASAIKWPALVNSPTRRDELWQTTCFECFIGTSRSPYLEINASPSGDWQAYYFTDYRQYSESIDEISVIASSKQSSQACKSMFLEVDINEPSFVTADWKISLSVVLEAHGRLEYYALHHPAQQPDFHLKELRCLDLPYTE